MKDYRITITIYYSKNSRFHRQLLAVVGVARADLQDDEDWFGGVPIHIVES